MNIKRFTETYLDYKDVTSLTVLRSIAPISFDKGLNKSFSMEEHNNYNNKFVKYLAKSGKRFDTCLYLKDIDSEVLKKINTIPYKSVRGITQAIDIFTDDKGVFYKSKDVAYLSDQKYLLAKVDTKLLGGSKEVGKVLTQKGEERDKYRGMHKVGDSFEADTKKDFDVSKFLDVLNGAKRFLDNFLDRYKYVSFLGNYFNIDFLIKAFTLLKHLKIKKVTAETNTTQPLALRLTADGVEIHISALSMIGGGSYINI